MDKNNLIFEYQGYFSQIVLKVSGLRRNDGHDWKLMKTTRAPHPLFLVIKVVSKVFKWPQIRRL
jgi:hypothetical protein